MSGTFRPMLACDYDPAKLEFPMVAMPKIDGVRAMNIGGKLTGRSLKPHKNRHTTRVYSHIETLGFDGEMIAGEDPTVPRLCSLTTSALNTVEGEPCTTWWLFDLVTPETMSTPYLERLRLLAERVLWLKENRKGLRSHPFVPSLMLVPHQLVHSGDALEEYEKEALGLGYEGVILRDPTGAYKQGRSTTREGGYLRIKRFAETEAVVIRILEGKSNGNEATKNELGYTERSSHKANMLPNGMVGALVCRDVQSGEEITVAAGTMTHGERLAYFQNQETLIGKTIKYKTFLHGVKDKPRFPTFQSIRAETDM